MRFDIYIHFGDFGDDPESVLLAIVNKLSRIEKKLDVVTINLEDMEIQMAQELDALIAQVTANTSAENSAITLIKDIAARLANNPTPAQIATLSAQLKSSADALGAAVVANTPSDTTA